VAFPLDRTKGIPSIGHFLGMCISAIVIPKSRLRLIALFLAVFNMVFMGLASLHAFALDSVVTRWLPKGTYT